MYSVLISCLLLIAGCGFGPRNIQSRYSTDLETRKIRRIAVLPPVMAGVEQKPKVPFATQPAADLRSSEKDASELLARLVYSTMASLSNWQIVSETEVREVGEGIPRTTEAARLKTIGEMVFADAVISGRVLRYRERVGEEWGAKSPASVAFVLDLIDVRRGDIIWSARFDETQKALSENILAIGEIGQRGVGWLSAEQLTHEGVKKAVNQLHQILAKNPT